MEKADVKSFEGEIGDRHVALAISDFTCLALKAYAECTDEKLPDKLE